MVGQAVGVTTIETPTAGQEAVVGAAVDALLASHAPVDTDRIAFLRARFDAGLAWVQFPLGHGGLGVRPQLQREVDSRLRAAGAPAPEPTQFFMNLAGPTILTHGTDEQKQRYLRPMFTGEELWCQLFSEPGAGSDFAGLSTRAVRDGDEWIVNGQKVWNTLAHLGHWAMLVTRTNPDVPKHRGLSYFLLDMHSPGVEVRPLRQITGEAEFNEVYLTDVRIPDGNRLGDEGDGWRVSLTTLMNERSSIGEGGGSQPGSGPIGEALRIWRNLPAEQRNAARRDDLMRLYVRSEALRLTNGRAAANRRTGNPGPEGSVAKLAMAELNKAIYELAVALLGAHGMVDYDYTYRRAETLSVDGGDARKGFLRVRANSIEGGTSEIMRNILGEQVLGLPGEPRLDKDVAWSQVPRN